MNTLDVLTQARALISDPSNWGQGIMREPNGKGGIRLCALAAIEFVAGVCFSYRCEFPAVGLLAETAKLDPAQRDFITSMHGHAAPNYIVAAYNDTRTNHQQALDWFDRTIALARTRPEVQAELTPPPPVELPLWMLPIGWIPALPEALQMPMLLALPPPAAPARELEAA